MVTVIHADYHPGDNQDATVASGSAATVNHATGSVTVTGLTTASNATYTQTINNNLVTADSIIGIEVYNGTNTSVGLNVLEVTPAAGSFTVNIKNTNAGALNGSIVIMFMIAT